MPYRLWEETREEEAGNSVENMDGRREANVCTSGVGVPRRTRQARVAKKTRRYSVKRQDRKEWGMFLLVHWLNSMPCRGSFRLDRSTSGRLLRYHNARSKCRRRDQHESRRGEGRGGGGGRTEGERKRGRGDSANEGNKGQTGGILDGEAGW